MTGHVDLQVNGFGGIDFSTPGLTVEKVRRVVEELKARDTTLFCPTLITADEEVYRANLPVLAAAADQPDLAPHIAGIHLEGPFFAPDSAGAHPREHLRPPCTEAFRRWQELAGGRIRILTLAPELPGADRLIREVTAAGVVVGLGHHMADSDSIRRAVDCGARLCTHLGNGIANTLPRHPNPLWAQLACDDLTASFITDGHHLPPEFIRVAWRAKGPDRFILTGDVASLAGLRPGVYDVWGRTMRVEDSGKICLPCGTVLAGSSALVRDCLAFLRTVLDLPDDDVVKITQNNALNLLNAG